MTPRSLRFLAVSSCLALAAPAAAQTDPVAEARASFQEGVRQYAQQHYAEALEAFRRAYRVRPHPSVLVNIANCHVALEQPQQAVTLFERYLADATANITPAQRTEIEQALESARRQLATVTVHVVPAGAEVFLDGDLVGVAPLRRPLQTSPGPHVFEARLSGTGTQQYQSRLVPGGQLTITLDLQNSRAYVGSVTPEATAAALRPPEPPPAPVVPVGPAVAPPVAPPPTTVVVAPPPPPPPIVGPGDPVDAPRSRFRGLFWGSLSVTLVSGGAAVGFAVYANNLVGEYNDLVARRDASRDPTERDNLQRDGIAYVDAVRSNRMVATVLGGVAGVGALVTVLAPILTSTRPASRASASLQVVPGLDGRSAVLSGTF